MRLVVDANVVISSLAAKGVSYKVFFVNSLLRGFEFIAPELLWKEVDKRMPTLLSEIKLPAEEIEEILALLKEEIDIMPSKEFIAFLPDAEAISPDQKDTQYFALALAFGCGIFSGDIALKKQSRIKVFTPRELLDILVGKM